MRFPALPVFVAAAVSTVGSPLPDGLRLEEHPSPTLSAPPARLFVDAPDKNVPAPLERAGDAGAAGIEAACTYTGLVSGVADTATVSPETFLFDQAYGYWTAVGIRPTYGEDWDLALYSGPGGAPLCVSGLLASSYGATGVDVVVTDFNHEAVGTRYLYANRFSGASDATIEWDSGPDVLPVDGSPVFRSTGPNDVLECWDVYLSAGVEYGFELVTDVGASLLVFHNPGSVPYNAGRSAAILDYPTNPTSSFVAPATDWYCVVVVNEYGTTGSYSVAVGTCGAVAPLASGVSQVIPAGTHHFTYDQTYGYWAAVAVRSEPPTDWALERYAFGSGAPWPFCFLSSQQGYWGIYSYDPQYNISLQATDYNGGQTPLGIQSLRAYLATPDTASGRIEWDGGADLLLVDAAPVWAATDSSDVVTIWDVYLEAGVRYEAVLQGTGNAVLVPMLFAPNGGFQFLGYGSTATDCHSFSVTASGYHGLAVFNGDGGSGTYGISVAHELVADLSPVVTGSDDSFGSAWEDFDGDGDLDVYVANYGGPNRLLVNDGFGGFAESTPAPLVLPGYLSLQPAWGDCDNDGDPDLLVSDNTLGLHLFRNDGGAAFADLTGPPLADSTSGGQHAGWIDADSDGILDIWRADWSSGEIFGGTGDGTFDVRTPAWLSGGPAVNLSWGDYDEDGDPDVYVTRYLAANGLYRNDGSWSFADVTVAPLDDAGGGYDATWGDFDGDGDLDLFVANNGGGSRLFVNEGGGVWSDRTSDLPADPTDVQGAMWTDANNDGYLDLFVTRMGGNDLVYDAILGFQSGITTPVGTPDYSAGGAWVDVEGDGDLDAYLTVRNTFTGANQLVLNDFCSTLWAHIWLTVRCRGVLSNRDGIGARVTLHVPGQTFSREITRHASGYSSSPALASFALYPFWGGTTIDSLTVRWPSGTRQTVIGPAPYQTITVIEDVTSVTGAIAQSAPATFALGAPEPNPFRSTTTIRYAVPRSGPASIRVYDVTGRLVRTLTDEAPAPGTHAVVWDGRDGGGGRVASGVYFYQLHAPDFRQTRKIVLVR